MILEPQPADAKVSAQPFELFLFTARPETAADAERAGINALVVDWEWRGKERRQEGQDTEINRDTADDLTALSSFAGRRCCRINGFGPWTAQEVDLAINNGATDLLLPMVRTVREVEDFLRKVDGRAGAGILVETADAVAKAPQLARLPLNRVYVGLNDLAIDRALPGLFRPLLEGTLERLRQEFQNQSFGFGGLTRIDAGSPVPCRLLLSEMARLQCDFSFLRRSFKRDVPGPAMVHEVERLRAGWQALCRRTWQQVDEDRRMLRQCLNRLYG